MKKKKLQKIVVQGLGYVGAATMAAISLAMNEGNKPKYKIIGLDLNSKLGRNRINLLNKGFFPFKSSDKKMLKAIKKASKEERLFATYDTICLKDAYAVIVNIPLDINFKNNEPYVNFTTFKKAIETIAKNISQTCLVLVETTVPPGTCEKVIMPILEKIFIRRNLDKNKIRLAHSYERVMPGPQYIDSIINNWRVYSANNKKAENFCKRFLQSFLNTSDFPLTKLSSMTSSETAKIMENSYRSTNIAFIEEWARFSEKIGINCYEVIEAIRKRPTHNNIRVPGFGVGGYCLTKDPYFGKVSAVQLFKNKNLKFPFSEKGLKTNRAMRLENLKLLKVHINSLKKKILVLGAAYRSEVDDLRNTPSEVFIDELIKNKANVFVHDPYVKVWKNYNILNKFPISNRFEIIILAVAHNFYRKLNFLKWLNKNNKIVLDANNIIKEKIRKELISRGNTIITTGRGDK